MRPIPTLAREAERFWARFDKNGPLHPKLGTHCWLWTGCHNSAGYGQLKFRGKVTRSHRVALELGLGIDLGTLQALHHCDTRICGNPEHLYPGTPLDNMRDKVRRGRHPDSRKTHCPQGHEYNDINTYRRNKRRYCRICTRQHYENSRAKAA